ncbi:hypothetical protein [Amycolatopsis pigmentata]|uniref:Uncharacterized protein n=1 Tax=Amycolatopsis pigmentata TaxID=450801 RepID=A0ABW5G7G9_9PSEU
MTNRLLMPNDAVREADIRRPDGTTRRYRGGIVTPADRHDEQALREFGATAAGLGLWSTRSSGRRCTACGFASFFARCGRCGGDCPKETPTCPASPTAE